MIEKKGRCVYLYEQLLGMATRISPHHEDVVLYVPIFLESDMGT